MLHSDPFKGSRWAVKGDLLLPAIFVMVADVFVRQWVTELAWEGFGRSVYNLSMLFYSYDRLISSP